MLFIIIGCISIVALSIFLVWLSEEIPCRNIIENLYQFSQPLTFTFKGVDFTVSKRELYSDFNVCITEVLINDETVLKAYKLTEHRYISYSRDRSEMEVKEILKQARKVYDKNLCKECKEKWQSKSYFNEVDMKERLELLEELKSKLRRSSMRKRITPCDGDDGMCPFDAMYAEDCRVCCGLGVDEDEEYTSSTYGDYSQAILGMLRGCQ